MNQPLLKANDIAVLLNISKSFAFRLMQRGDIPTIRIGKSARVRQEDLDWFVMKNYLEVSDGDKNRKLAAGTASSER